MSTHSTPCKAFIMLTPCLHGRRCRYVVHIIADQSSSGWHGGVTGAHVTLDGLVLKNAGWKWQALNPDKPMTEEQAIRFAPALLGPCRAVLRHGCMAGAGTVLRRAR